MTPSEKLDREVAQKILGIRCVSQKMTFKLTTGRYPTGYQLQWPGGSIVSRAMSCYGWGWHDKRESAWFHCPKFSSDITAAWVVWQTLAENYQYFRAFVGALGHQDSGGDLVNSLMKLTPQTICKTALAVLRKTQKARTG